MLHKKQLIIILLSTLLFVLFFPCIEVTAEAQGQLVGTSTTNTAVYDPFQRKTFHASGLFWVFYTNGTRMVYRTSTDGLTWSELVDVRACMYGYYFSVTFDGTFLHYAVRDTWSLLYRRGLPNSDGSITWSTAEQTVCTGSSGNFHRQPTIAVDSAGHVWIGTDQNLGGFFYPWAWKNNNTDGTWANATGFPYQLNTNSSDWRTIIVPLTSAKVYVIYTSTYTPYTCGRLYDNGWSPEDTNFTEYYLETDLPNDCSAVAYGDVVYFSYVRRTTYEVRMSWRTDSWQTEELVQDSVDQNTAPVLSVANGQLYCFWAKLNHHIYYKKRSDNICGGTLTLNLIACPSGEQITNGGFETGDFTGWTKYGDPWVTDWNPHTGTYACETWTVDDAIEQEFTPIAYACISSFTIWTKQSFSTVTAELEVTVTYEDDTQLQWIEGHRGHVDYVETDVKAKLDPAKKVKKIKLRQKVGIDTDGWAIDDISFAFLQMPQLRVTSNPELHVNFKIDESTYQTPQNLSVSEGTYTISILDTYIVVNGTPYTFIFWNVNGTTDYYQSVITLTITDDTNLTAYYFVGAFRRKPVITPTPEEVAMKRCFPLTFYIIMTLITLLSLYLYANRELWKITPALIAVIAWLLWLKPCPTWDFYIALAMSGGAISLLLNKLREK